MKGVDVLKLRGTHTKINRRVGKLQDTINKKLSHIINQQKENHPSSEHEQKNYFCVINEREIFQCLAFLIKTEPVFNLTASSMLNILIDHTNRSQIHDSQDEYFDLV